MKHLRAVLVLLHCLAIFLLSFPAPVGVMNERSFAAPATQATFESYAGALQSVGLDVSKDELQQFLWDEGTRFMAVRSRVVAPFQRYLQAVGAGQGWRMFGTVNRAPAWLVVEVQEGEDWRIVYESRSEEHTWRRRQFDQERTRALVNDWSWLRGKASYEQFGVWLAQRAAVDFPQATHLRTRMERRKLPPPEVLRTQGMPEPTVHWETRYSLDKHR